MSIMAKLTDEQREALHSGGFAWNPSARCWTGYGLSVKSSRIAHLDLWQVDQVIAAAKAGKRIVRLGPDKRYRFA